MSKPSRRRQGRPGSTPTGATPRPPATPPATGPTSSASSTDETVSKTSTRAGSLVGHHVPRVRHAAPEHGADRDARTGRRTRSTYQQRSFAERHRGTIIGIAAIAGVALIGVFFFYSASRPLFQCTNIWEPTPTASPLPGASPAPGYVQDDMGRLHVPPGEVVKYTYCPPASGNHYFAAGLGPIPARFYGVNDKTSRRAGSTTWSTAPWSCSTGADSEGATTDGPTGAPGVLRRVPAQPGLQHHARARARVRSSRGSTRWRRRSRPSCGAVSCRSRPSTPPRSSSSTTIWGERTNPEPQCAPPTPSADPGASGSPSASPSASRGSAAPSASPAARQRQHVGLGERQRARRAERQPRGLAERQPELTGRVRACRRGTRTDGSAACRTVRTCSPS